MTRQYQGQVWSVSCAGPPYPLIRLLDQTALPERIAGQRRILIKPNLVEALAPPITTPVDLVAALVIYLRQRSQAEIMVAEGAGARDYDTQRCFEQLGYIRMARELGVPLIDLNQEPLLRLERQELPRWPTMHLPRIALDCFLLSVPVLKAHSLAGVTLTMKNMMGLAPPSQYQEECSWKKSAFHDDIQAAVRDLNLYRCADFTLMDATVGMAQAHLWGPTCSPPIHRLLAGHDPVAMDSHASSLLGRSWRQIGHIRDLDGILGLAEPVAVHTLTSEPSQQLAAPL